MNIISSHAYNGRNIYSHSPVIKLVIDLEEYYDTPSNMIDGFTDKLIEILPGIYRHKCSRGHEGGFVERLREGTYLGHILEHVAIEIQNLLGYDIKFGKTRQADNERIYNVIYGFTNELAGMESGLLAVEIVNCLLESKSCSFDIKLEELRKKCIAYELGSSTSVIKAEAEKRNIPVIRIADGSLLQLGYGRNQRRLQATLTENSSCIAVDTSCNKSLSNSMFREYGIPVPDGKVVRDEDEAVKYSEELGYPVVVKPNFGNQGKGVSVNLCSPEEVREAFRIASEFKDTILVEKYIEGEHYRLLVIGNKMAAAAQRLCAQVIGDGKSTIMQLIEKENCNPLRGEGHEKPLTKIKVDRIIESYLKKHNMSLDYVPLAGQQVQLRENDNLSTGGIAVDVTNTVHPENAELAVLAAGIIGLDVAGIDITTKDISIPIKATGGAIIEINAAPGIRMHHHPTVGEPRNVAKEIVNLLCPEEKDYTIPIVSVTGTNGKTTTVRMISHIISSMGYTVGMTTTSGVYIGNTCINKGDNTGPISAKTVLMNRTVDYAVLETARGGIVKRGLGYAAADAGIITNISEDHLGIDGINTIEDLAFVKSLVVEAIKPGGYAILNADDPNCVALSERVKSDIIYFSTDAENKVISAHAANNGTAFFKFNNCLCICKNGEIVPFITVADIPATHNGLLEYNIYNSLAAAAGAHALGISLDDIAKGLGSFKGNVQDNPGRFNMFDINGISVILDYGHNIDAYRCIIDTLKKMKKNKLIGVIGVPGDRTDSSTYKIGQMCGNSFDRIFIKEDKDRRGRAVGEIAQILEDGCRDSIIDPKDVTIELSEEKALEKAILSAEPNDIVIVFYEEYHLLLDVLEKVKKDMSNKELITA
ncbi:MAG: cyanophycin synthetase [Bacillota bacterium]